MSRWNRAADAARIAALFAAVLAIAACRSQVPGGTAPAAEPFEPAYRAAAARGETVYRLDPSQSHAVFLVRREGPLARLGHDHAIRALGLQGFLRGTDGDRQGDLEWPVSHIEVDPPDLRRRFELETEPDAEDIAGTRKNLLRHVLVADRWPTARVHISEIDALTGSVKVRAELTLNGVTRAIEMPVMLAVDGDDLRATGRFSLRQTDWGIEPFSILGGALRVGDEVEVYFELGARRWRPSPE